MSAQYIFHDFSVYKYFHFTEISDSSPLFFSFSNVSLYFIWFAFLISSSIMHYSLPPSSSLGHYKVANPLASLFRLKVESRCQREINLHSLSCQFHPNISGPKFSLLCKAVTTNKLFGPLCFKLLLYEADIHHNLKTEWAYSVSVK